MKKLTKKKLDELTKTMPVVDEMEQRNFIGGTFYFDYSGKFLGQIGSGNDVLIGTSIIDSNAIFLSSASEETMGKVLTTIGRTMGISGDIAIAHGDERFCGGHESGQIYVNYDANFKKYNNYYDFLAVLHHEHYHQMMWQYGYDFSNDQNEYQALIYEMNQVGFQNTSEFYKSGTLNAYNSYGSGYYGSSGNSGS